MRSISPRLATRPSNKARALRFEHSTRAWLHPPPYFRLMVVFTPWLVVESSNQRAVIVLVCV